MLLCTDVAARGLDFPEVTTIIQYDAPGEAAECALTARMLSAPPVPVSCLGKVGEAVLFLMPFERAYLGNLEAKGVQLRPLNVLPALDLLPPDTTQQVSAASQAVQGTARVSCTCKQLATSEDMPQSASASGLAVLLP